MKGCGQQTRSWSADDGIMSDTKKISVEKEK
jgi:hypothetical protein